METDVGYGFIITSPRPSSSFIKTELLQHLLSCLENTFCSAHPCSEYYCKDHLCRFLHPIFFLLFPSLYCPIQAPCLPESCLWPTQAHFPWHSTSSPLPRWLQTPTLITTFPVRHFCASLLHKHLKNNFIIPTEKLPHLTSSLHK